MASGRAADREDPENSKRKAARNLDRDPISELHQGQRSYAPHQWAEHMTASDHIAKAASKILACGGRPHMSYAYDLLGWLHSRMTLQRAIEGAIFWIPG